MRWNMPDDLKILFIGDIVGKIGRRMVAECLPVLVKEHGIGLCIANCENAAGGFGITPKVADQLFSCGVHLLTSGNHIWDKVEGIQLLDQDSRLLRPANYPPDTPGRGMTVVEAPGGERVGVLNLCGRVFLDPVDCPFRTADREIAKLRAETRIILVDMHGEATSEKVAMGWYLDGRVSAVVGTHTHVQTADERVLTGGTAYITDAGMTGPADSVIGIRKEMIIEKFLTHLPRRFEIARGEGQFNAVIVHVQRSTGLATHVSRSYLRSAWLSQGQED